MQAIRVLIAHKGHLVGEEIYLLHTEQEALERSRARHADIIDQVTICAFPYDTEKNKQHYEACEKCGCVFFFNTSY